jgi:hypothetical protein
MARHSMTDNSSVIVILPFQVNTAHLNMFSHLGRSGSTVWRMIRYFIMTNRTWRLAEQICRIKTRIEEPQN